MAPERIAALDESAEATLRDTLDSLVLRYNQEYLDSDPLMFLRRYERPKDQEVVGLIAASLAYGRVVIIQRSVEHVLRALGTHPYDTIATRAPVNLGDFKHRFNDATDMHRLLELIGIQLRRVGTLGALFMEGYSPEDETIIPALTHFVETIYGSEEGESLRYLLTSPRGGSACKRMFMYLRWMIRRDDGVDLGLWKDVPASKLLMPLDTHTFRIGRYLGLLERRTADLAAAVEITQRLRELSPEDPVRYDFALARLGILELCPAQRDANKCAACSLFDVCRLR